MIAPDFKTVKSDFSNSYYYALNGDLMLRDYAPRSIIPQHKVFRPKKLEIWVFDEAPGVLEHQKDHSDELSESSFNTSYISQSSHESSVQRQSVTNN